MHKLIKIAIGLMYAGLVSAAELPDAFIQRLADKVISDLRANKVALKQQPEEARQIIRLQLLPHMYVQGMARAVLGRQMWQSIDENQRKQFKALLTNMVIHTYARVLENYQDEAIKVYPIQKNDRHQSRVEVRSIVKRTHAPPIPLNYRLVQRQERWYIYDMLVEGISMLQNFRSQINEELSHRSFAQLLQTMEAHYGSSQS